MEPKLKVLMWQRANAAITTRASAWSMAARVSVCTWYIGEAHQARAELDDAPCEAIMELMESRGGDVLCYAGGREYPEFEPPEPGCIFD